MSFTFDQLNASFLNENVFINLRNTTDSNPPPKKNKNKLN